MKLIPFPKVHSWCWFTSTHSTLRHTRSLIHVSNMSHNEALASQQEQIIQSHQTTSHWLEHTLVSSVSSMVFICTICTRTVLRSWLFQASQANTKMQYHHYHCGHIAPEDMNKPAASALGSVEWKWGGGASPEYVKPECKQIKLSQMKL